LFSAEDVYIEYRKGRVYPAFGPNPSQLYPEYLFGSGALQSEENLAYDMVCNCLKNMGYDAEYYGMAEWKHAPYDTWKDRLG